MLVSYFIFLIYSLTVQVFGWSFSEASFTDTCIFFFYYLFFAYYFGLLEGTLLYYFGFIGAYCFGFYSFFSFQGMLLTFLSFASFVLTSFLLFIYNNYQVKMNQEQMQEVYKMVDNVPFSRPKKNINRDFSDAVMVAQLLYYYNPKLVELHNYPPANSTTKKIQNWNTLNLKVLKKLNLTLSKQQIEGISNCVPGVIEQFLHQIFVRFEKPEEQGKLGNTKMMDSKGNRLIDQNQNQQPSNKQNIYANRKHGVNVSSQTEEIIKLVEQIDEATQKLRKVKQICKNKDQIIFTLEKKLQKVIFG